MQGLRLGSVVLSESQSPESLHEDMVSQRVCPEQALVCWYQCLLPGHGQGQPLLISTWEHLVRFGRPCPHLVEEALWTMYRTAPWLVGWKKRGWGFLSCILNHQEPEGASWLQQGEVNSGPCSRDFQHLVCSPHWKVFGSVLAQLCARGCAACPPPWPCAPGGAAERGHSKRR